MRAITRIATPENEEALVELALHATAAHVESVVRAYRGVLSRELVGCRRRALAGRHNSLRDVVCPVRDAELVMVLAAAEIDERDAARSALGDQVEEEDQSG